MKKVPNEGQMLWAMVFCIAAVYIFGGVAVVKAAQSQDIDVSPCIKEIQVKNDTLHIGWTTPPCNLGIDPRNVEHHNAIRHAAVPMKCGQIIVFTSPIVALPVVDTLSIRCEVQSVTD